MPFVGGHLGERTLTFLDQSEIDLATIQIHTTHLDTNPGTDRIANTCPFTAQLLPSFIETEILPAQLGDMNQALYIHRIERHEQTKRGRRRHNP